jgi:hypothetical protein
MLAVFIFLFASVRGETQTLGTFPQNSKINLIQTCPDCTYINATVYYPNMSVAQANTEMSLNANGVYNVTFNKTDALGLYIYFTIGDPSGSVTTQPVAFYITPNGEEKKGDNFFIFNYLLFFVCLIFMIPILVLNITTLASSSTTIYNVIVSWTYYLILFVTYTISQSYSFVAFIKSNLTTFLVVASFSYILLPMFGLVIGIFIRSTQKKQVLSMQDMNGRLQRYA